MMVEHRAVGTERENAVVECAASGSFIHAFAHAHHECDPICARHLRQRARRITGHGDALFGHATKHRLHGRVIPEGNIAADVEPDGIAGQPRLRKHDERCTLCSSLSASECGSCKAVRKIAGNEGLDDRGADSGHVSFVGSVRGSAPQPSGRRRRSERPTNCARRRRASAEVAPIPSVDPLTAAQRSTVCRRVSRAPVRCGR